MSLKSLSSATAILLALTPSAFAQDVPDEDVIIVEGRPLYSDQINALKTPTPIIDVPQSLSIVTADEIAQRGYNSCLLYTSPSPRDRG